MLEIQYAYVVIQADDNLNLNSADFTTRVDIQISSCFLICKIILSYAERNKLVSHTEADAAVVYIWFNILLAIRHLSNYC